jgi:type II secretory pathway pseudopilin PulG
MSGAKTHKGFTIIELTLAMTFISVLLITIVILVMQITRIYAKGTTIKNVNSVGRSLISDFQQTVGASPVTPDLGAASGPKYMLTDAAGGRFCTGAYSYIWNTGRRIVEWRKDGSTSLHKFNSVPVRLLKVRDQGRIYCNSGTDIKTFADGIELISSNESEIAVYDFHVYPPIIDDNANANGQALYTISFVLGTMGNNTDDDGVVDTNNQCKPPAAEKSDFNYCAINKFDLTVRAMGSN